MTISHRKIKLNRWYLISYDVSMIFILNSHAHAKEWEEKFAAMEGSLASIARHAEKERDAPQIQLDLKEVNMSPSKETTEFDTDLEITYLQLLEENKQQKEWIIQLKDRSAWQSELEQV